ncbi:C4-dicarboxylate ABC transporter substrate-binding protein, partial [Candidatus Magnetomorum sp. HK-1]
FYTVGHPSTIIAEATSSQRPVRIIPIKGEPIDELISNKPYYAYSTIPNVIYPEILNSEPIESIGVKATFVTTIDTPVETVYTICKEMFENFDAFKEMHPAYKALIQEDFLKGLTAPFHPGAIQYFQEIEMIKNIRIGTGSVKGVYYPTGIAISDIINQKTGENSMSCKAFSTDGSVFNINAVVSGELEFGIAQSDRQYQAVNALAEWKESGSQTKLRGVFSIHPESVTLIASEESGINSVWDLKGKKVNLGNPGSGQLQNSLDALVLFNISIEDDLTPMYEKASDAFDLLMKGEIDAVFYTVGHPSKTINDLLTSDTKALKLVPITSVVIDAIELNPIVPYYVVTTIPADAYPDAGIESDIKTFGVKATVVTSEYMPEDIVYKMTKGIFENLDEFKQLHPAFKNLTKINMLEAMSAEFHEGSKRYYQEVGLMP